MAQPHDRSSVKYSSIKKGLGNWWNIGWCHLGFRQQMGFRAAIFSGLPGKGYPFHMACWKLKCHLETLQQLLFRRIWSFKGANERRWMSHGPCLRSAPICAAVPYPLCALNPYSGHFLSTQETPLSSKKVGDADTKYKLCRQGQIKQHNISGGHNLVTLAQEVSDPYHPRGRRVTSFYYSQLTEPNHKKW